MFKKLTGRSGTGLQSAAPGRCMSDFEFESNRRPRMLPVSLATVTTTLSRSTAGATLAEVQIRDPFVVPDHAHGRYLLFGTSGFGEVAHGGFVVRTSEDLARWSEPRAALAPADGPAGAQHFWAPEVHAYRGRWYLLGSFSHGSVENPDRRYTRIYVADEATGPFRPVSAGPITPEGWLCIDGTLHVAEDGTPWLVFVREWVQVTDGEMHAMPLTADLSAPAGEPRLLFRASEAAWSRPQTWGNFTGFHVTDGPWLHRTARGVLLMLWSSFGGGGYSMGVAQSESGQVAGPWSHAPEPLVANDGGHGMVFRDLRGELHVTWHTPNIVGRERAIFRRLHEAGDGLVLG